MATADRDPYDAWPGHGPHAYDQGLRSATREIVPAVGRQVLDEADHPAIEAAADHASSQAAGDVEPDHGSESGLVFGADLGPHDLGTHVFGTILGPHDLGPHVLGPHDLGPDVLGSDR